MRTNNRGLLSVFANILPNNSHFNIKYLAKYLLL